VGVHVGATRQTEDDFEMTPEAERKRGPRAAGWNPTDTTRVFGMPRGVWNWRGTALVLLLVTVPQLITLTVGDGTESPAVEAARLSGLVTFPVVLGAAVLIYFHWRISGGTQTAWLAAGLTAVGVQGILLEGLRLAKPETVEKLLGWMMIVDLAFAAVLLLIVILAERKELPFDPVAAGITLGLVVTGVRYALAVSAPDQEPGVEVLVSWSLALFAIYMLVAYAVFHLSSVPTWARARLALATILLALHHLVFYPSVDDPFRSFLAVAGDLVGAVLLCSMAVALLRLSIVDSTQAVDELTDRVHEVEAAVRADRERLHEITGTVAGIASASRLIHQGADISASRKSHLQRMLSSEIGRLERLMGERPTDVGSVDLDAILWPLVVAHRARGHQVQWEQSGLTAAGRPDDISEVMNILLNNAAAHAPGTTATIDVRRVEGSVEIAVSDSGPGVPRAVSAHMFEWGARGPASTGQGIGLHVAHRLMNEQHGYLRVVNRPRGGATFLVGLPADGEDHDAAHSAAQ
jgi:signal transduction histidine kinase